MHYACTCIIYAILVVSSQAYEAARSQRHNCRRRSAFVELPASSVQMDLHVTTEEPTGEGYKGIDTFHLSIGVTYMVSVYAFLDLNTLQWRTCLIIFFSIPRKF